MKKILLLRHIHIEGPGTIEAFLKEEDVPYAILDVFRNNGAALVKQKMDAIGAVVILGGPMNVYEEAKHPFLKAEKQFIREVINNKIPLLGICLGAQLVACSLGAQVKRAPQKEIGWYDVSLEKAAKTDPLFKTLGNEIKVFQWHEDTFDLPKDAVLLAKKNGMNQAFRVGDNAWGLQFHIEVDGDMIIAWCKEYIKEGNPASCWEDYVTRYLDLEDNFKGQSEQIYTSFLSLLHR